jgi:hypothetical protein
MFKDFIFTFASENNFYKKIIFLPVVLLHPGA